MKTVCYASLALSLIVFGQVEAGAVRKWFHKDSASANSIGTENKNNGSDEALTGLPSIKQDEQTNDSPTKVERKKIIGDPVVLRVGKTEIKRSQVIEELQALPANITSQFKDKPDRLFAVVCDGLLQTHLLVEQAKKMGLERDPKFRASLENVKKNILARMVLNKELAPKVNNPQVIKSRYVRYIAEYKPVKEYKLMHIHVKSEAEAKDIVKRLESGISFNKLAKEKSIAKSKDQDGFEGYLPLELSDDELAKKLILLKKGEYTKNPMVMQDGYHLFKIDDIRDSSPPSEKDAEKLMQTLLIEEETQKLRERLETQYKVERFNEDGTPTEKFV